MTRHLVPWLACAALLLPALGEAADIARGKELHQANCMQCHGTGVYVRDDRRIHSLEALQHQVKRCKTALGAAWPDDQVDDVVEYLNRNFYRFE